MAEKSTVARPYAKAVFEIAKGTKDYEKWSRMLGLLSIIAQNERVKRVLPDYTINPKELAEFFIEIGGEQLDYHAKNLVNLLAQRRRLRVLPEISEHYEKFRNDAENTLEAECITAVPITESVVESFKQYLKSRLGRTAKMVCTVDPKILGGFWLRAGDKVIDGSLRGQLAKLQDAMSGLAG